MSSSSERHPTLNILIPHAPIHRYSKRLLEHFSTGKELPDEAFDTQTRESEQSSPSPEQLVADFVHRLPLPILLLLYPTILVIRVLPTRFILTNGHSIILKSRQWFLSKRDPTSGIKKNPPVTQDDVADAILKLSSTLREFSKPARGRQFHEILTQSSILCEDMKTLMREEKEYTKWKLKQHEDIDKRIQPLRSAVQEVKKGIRELTPEYEQDHIFSTTELALWIGTLQHAQEEFEKDMGIKYKVLGDRIYAVQAEVNFLLGLKVSSTRGNVKKSYRFESVGNGSSYASEDGSLDIRGTRGCSKKEDEEIPLPDSPPAQSVIPDDVVIQYFPTPENTIGRVPLSQPPKHRGRSRTSKGSSRSSSLTAYQRHSGKPYSKRSSISPRSSLLRSKLEAEDKDRAVKIAKDRHAPTSSTPCSEVELNADTENYNNEESDKNAAALELSQALEEIVNEMDERKRQREELPDSHIDNNQNGQSCSTSLDGETLIGDEN
ncbi:hypothetical protein HYFRA_00013765 [Hymenoscyphus fraxineus]|uniref:Uncharacterized protein n=1 Tax=Hymenoscyphus fraxineus TaxID=746836 RepID=A0A9N9L8A0_9HELO|nr:hypothetical protein HYFRA_00013765 [Hymenoscyphus fraxineus]